MTATVVIGICAKNCGQYLRQLAGQLTKQDHPQELVRIRLLENDSEDDTAQAAQAAVDILRRDGWDADFASQEFGFRLPHKSRHLPEAQAKRWENCARVRQAFLAHFWYGQEADYLVWLDADLLSVPADYVSVITGFGVDRVMPTVILPSGVPYDLTTRALVDGQELRIPQMLRRPELARGPLVKCVAADAMSATSRRALEAVDFCDPTPGESEGTVFSKRLSAAGMDSWWAPGVLAIHRDVQGMTPLPEELARQFAGALSEEDQAAINQEQALQRRLLTEEAQA